MTVLSRRDLSRNRGVVGTAPARTIPCALWPAASAYGSVTPEKEYILTWLVHGDLIDSLPPNMFKLRKKHTHTTPARLSCLLRFNHLGVRGAVEGRPGIYDGPEALGAPINLRHGELVSGFLSGECLLSSMCRVLRAAGRVGRVAARASVEPLPLRRRRPTTSSPPPLSLNLGDFGRRLLLLLLLLLLILPLPTWLRPR